MAYLEPPPLDQKNCPSCLRRAAITAGRPYARDTRVTYARQPQRPAGRLPEFPELPELTTATCPDCPRFRAVVAAVRLPDLRPLPAVCLTWRRCRPSARVADARPGSLCRRPAKQRQPKARLGKKGMPDPQRMRRSTMGLLAGQSRFAGGVLQWSTAILYELARCNLWHPLGVGSALTMIKGRPACQAGQPTLPGGLTGRAA